MSDKITKRERAAIDALKEVAKQWPDSLWLYSAAGTLCVVKKKSGTVVMAESGRYDQTCVVDTVNIENDGGDW